MKVPYGFYPEMPPILSYLGLEIRHTNIWCMWEVYQIEWARECAIELIYEALGGRVWWLAPTVIDVLNQYRLEAIFPDERESNLRELHGLLHEIRFIRWDMVRVDQRRLPRQIGAYCPVYASGDWVPFNPDTWNSHMDDCTYLNDIDVSPHGWPSGRGVRQSGTTDSRLMGVKKNLLVSLRTGLRLPSDLVTT